MSADRATILIVDDDPEITSALERGLAMHGYCTVSEDRIEPAQVKFRDPNISAAIIDVMIGRESGIDLVRQIRAEANRKPILMLSALSDVQDRTAGLEAGADDYIVKPFSFDELVARLKVQQQRAGRPAAGVFDLATRMVTTSDQSATLTEREAALLDLFLKNRREILSRGMIFDTLWAAEGTSSENVVDVYIGYLRKKLAPLNGLGFEIKTVRNRGFILELSSQ